MNSLFLYFSCGRHDFLGALNVAVLSHVNHGRPARCDYCSRSAACNSSTGALTKPTWRAKVYQPASLRMCFFWKEHAPVLLLSVKVARSHLAFMRGRKGSLAWGYPLLVWRGPRSMRGPVPGRGGCGLHKEDTYMTHKRPP